jgi:hypothetical protein
MKTQFGKIALAATLGLATIFTLSCSDDKDNDGTSSNSVAEISSSSDGGGNSSSSGGSLNGNWQLGDATLEINGAQFSIEEPSEKFGGPISYDGSRATLTANSYWNGSQWQQFPPQYVTTGTISYMLSSDGNTLTISGFPQRDDNYNGAWTKISDDPPPPPTGGGSDWDGTWQIEGEPYKIQFSGNEFFFQINGIAVVKGTVAFAPTHISMNGTHYISSSEININPPQWHPYSAVNFWKLEFDYAKNADGSVNISNFVSNNTKDGEEELPDTLLIKE